MGERAGSARARTARARIQQHESNAAHRTSFMVAGGWWICRRPAAKGVGARAPHERCAAEKTDEVSILLLGSQGECVLSVPPDRSLRVLKCISIALDLTQHAHTHHGHPKQTQAEWWMGVARWGPRPPHTPRAVGGIRGCQARAPAACSRARCGRWRCTVRSLPPHCVGCALLIYGSVAAGASRASLRRGASRLARPARIPEALLPPGLRREWQQQVQRAAPRTCSRTRSRTWLSSPRCTRKSSSCPPRTCVPRACRAHRAFA